MAKDNKKIRVLEVVSGLSTEGIGSLLLNVYENMDKEDVEISFALATKYEQFYEKRLINQGAKIYRTSEIGDGITGKVKHFINLIKIIKKEGPFDVVHTHMDFFNGINLLAAFISGVRLRISHAHLSVDKKQLSVIKRIYNLIMKILIKLFSNERLGCSESANIYMNGINNGIVINNGVDLNKFKNNKNKLCLKGNSKVINFVTIGRIEEQKNPLFIVKIINELNKINSNIHLYWIGVGTMENRVKDLISQYKLEDKITLLGKRGDVPQILKNIDYMLFPSKWEGLPVTLIEVQAANIPCFVSDSITKEADLGLCTYLSLNENEKTWAMKINNYIKNNTFNKRINEEKLNRFDIKYTVKQLKSVYMR